MPEVKKILFCWSDVSGYMAACWKALALVADVEVHIIAFNQSSETSFQDDLLMGLNFYPVNRNPSVDEVKSIIEKVSPEVIVICGWFVSAYRKAPHRIKIKKRIKIILAMDTPWQGTLKQKIATVALKPFVRNTDAVITSGERSYQYARRLGGKRIFKFQYGVDFQFLQQAYYRRKERAWPKIFLFVGRYVEEKGVNKLVQAYNAYRNSVNEPWELHTCGQGSMKDKLVGDGIVDHGFVQPHDMIQYWANAGCLVLASTFDPWPLIVVEGCASGLPVIATHASGSQAEVIKSFVNGLVINENSVEELTCALTWMHEHYDFLPEMGERSWPQALPYDSKLWALKYVYMIDWLNASKAN